MVTKKDLIIAVLATFCLTATVFMVIPIRSSTNPYDAWIDYNDDGKISLADLSALANSYGTTGDPTKNVNVANLHDYAVQIARINISSYFFGYNEIFCGGYSRLSIVSCNPRNISIGVNNYITICISEIEWYTSWEYCSAELLGSSNFSVTIYSDLYVGSRPLSYITETKAPYCRFVLEYRISSEVNLPEDWWLTLDYTVYLRNE
jgi:hypothetical protein